MSSDKITMVAEKREVTGKKVKALRDAGIFPANIYGKGAESIAIQMPFPEMLKVWAKAGKNTPVEITIDGKMHYTLIKTVSYDPVKATLSHVEFHAINQNDPVEAEVQVRIEGDVPAEQQGNFIVRPTKEVLVKAVPSKLPHVVIAMADTLKEPGDTLKVSDIQLPEGVEMITDGNLTIAVVEEPRAVEETEAEEVDPASVPTDNGGATDGESSGEKIAEGK